MFNAIEAVPAIYWELAGRSGDYFLQREYLGLLEAQPPGVLEFSYLLFFYQGQAAGIAYGQIVEFRADEHLRQQETDGSSFRDLLASRIHLRVLMCGNMLLSGQHAFYFLPDYAFIAGSPLREALRKTADHWRTQGLNINTILVKDLNQSERSTIEDWSKSAFHQLKFQPNMVLPVPVQWKQFDDYLDSLSSKYRVRYRRAKKKMKGIKCLELNLEQIRTYESEIYRLYRSVADSSQFCVGYLSPQYFSEFKARAHQDFRLWGYFQSGNLVGFCTTIRNGQELEAHFLGLSEQQQQQQLYLNMLYHLVEVAIESRVDQLVFSRTAMEIKSSVGAIAIPTSVFLLHHTSSLVNALIPQLIGWLEPKEDWIARHPFREAETVRIR